MEIKIKWQNKDGEWIEFPLADIWHMPRTHAINLFSGKVPVIARQKETYIVNSQVLLKQYQHNKKKVKLFRELEPCELKLSVAGLL